MSCLAPYDLDALRIEGHDVVVNRPKVSAYRAPGATNAAFAVETVVDELAVELGMDPIDFRLRNAAREGTAQPMGPKFKRIGLVELLQAAKAHPHWTAPLGEPGRARRGRPDGAGNGAGAAAARCGAAAASRAASGSTAACSRARRSASTPTAPRASSPARRTSAARRTACAMIAAEELGIPVDQVRPTVADTDSIGYTDVTGGSRVAMATGLAVYEAAQDVKRQLCERAARMWQIAPEEVRFENGAAVAANGDQKPLAVREIAAQLRPHRWSGRRPRHGQRAARGRPGVRGPRSPTSRWTSRPGKVDVVRATVLQDAGRAIHPAYVEGQMQGGTAQGIGWALNEEYVYDEQGTLQNAGFLDYRMPVANDLPMIEPVIIEVPNPSHPLGVRGVGEVSIVPPPAAIANAIHRAVGVRLHELPMSPPRVLAALGARNS